MKVANYFKEAYSELVHKVSWPTWGELSNSAVLVMIASLIFALIILAMDLIFENLMQAIYSILY